MPADCATPSETENKNNSILLQHLTGVPKSILNRQASLHETYGLPVAQNHNGDKITIGNLFGGALQGIYRQNITSPTELVKVLPEDSKAFKDFKEQYESQKLSSGSLTFGYQFNQSLYDRNLTLLGEEILTIAKQASEDFSNLGKGCGFEGFTAGISGNAMHYALTTAKLAEETNSTLDIGLLKEVCINHLVGDSLIKPVHHSLPETLAGLYIGLKLYEKGIFKPEEKLLTINELSEILDESIHSATMDSIDLFFKSKSFQSQRKSFLGKHLLKRNGPSSQL